MMKHFLSIYNQERRLLKNNQSEINILVSVDQGNSYDRAPEELDEMLAANEISVTDQNTFRSVLGLIVKQKMR